ncbi:MAG: hypothetical protein MRJ68_09230 [Nitrospira sp.]|nr:hypothetical protein [Nitrospira sp.]
MKEPSTIGDKGEKLSGHEAEAYALNASKRTEDAQIESDLYAAMTGEDLEATRGRHNRGHARKGETERKRKEQEEFDTAYRAAIRRAQELIDQINKQIDDYTKFIHQLAQDAAELAQARQRLEDGESLEAVLQDKALRQKLEEYERRTGRTIDWNDRHAVEEAMLEEEHYRVHEADKYRERIQELEQDKAEIEKVLGEVERSDLSADQALKRMQEIVERGKQETAQEIWWNEDVSQQIKAIVGDAHTQDYKNLESGNETFAQFAGTSFSGKAGIGKGIQTTAKPISPTFAGVVDQCPEKKLDPTSGDTPTLKGPKVPS